MFLPKGTRDRLWKAAPLSRTEAGQDAELTSVAHNQFPCSCTRLFEPPSEGFKENEGQETALREEEFGKPWGKAGVLALNRAVTKDSRDVQVKWDATHTMEAATDTAASMTVAEPRWKATSPS